MSNGDVEWLHCYPPLMAIETSFAHSAMAVVRVCIVAIHAVASCISCCCSASDPDPDSSPGASPVSDPLLWEGCAALLIDDGCVISTAGTYSQYREKGLVQL